MLCFTVFMTVSNSERSVGGKTNGFEGCLGVVSVVFSDFGP